MPNNALNDIGIIEEFEEEEEFSRDDFGFVIGADGGLKSIMYPAHLMDDPPEEVRAILQLFGIDSLHTLEHKTVH